VARKMGRPWGALTFLIVLACCVTDIAAAQDQSGLTIIKRDFATPEAAVQYFVDQVIANNLYGALEACVVNEADIYDFQALTKRLNAMSLAGTLGPSKGPFMTQINRINLAFTIARQIKFMVFSLLINDEGQLDMPIGNPTDAFIDSFIAAIDTRRLSELQLTKVAIPHPDILNSSDYRKNARLMALPYGADDFTERVALYSFGGRWYIGGFSLLQYGKNWKISSLSSPLLGQSAFGILEKASRPADFEDVAS
jgi:hypothetical protein